MLKGFAHVLDHVDDYLHDVLSPPDAEYVKEHCAACTICEAALQEARKRQAVVESVPPVEAPEELIQTTVERLKEEADRRATTRRWAIWSVVGVAAALFLMLSVAQLYYSRMTATYDLSVLGQQQLLAATHGSLRIHLTNHATGAAVAGVPVKVQLRDTRKGRLEELVAFNTDAEGSGQPRFELPDWEDGDYELRISAGTWNGPDEVVRSVQLHRAWKLMLTCDKPVYQPGQAIQVRALALRRPDLRPVPNHEMTFSITDPRENIIFKRQDLTSKFGIGAIECPLASEILEGTYTIACRVGNTESRLAIEVKKYVLPKFKVAVELNQPFYQPSQKVRGTVQVDYIFGQPVVEGAVSIRAQTADVGTRVFQELQTTTDKTGKAEFEFSLPSKLFGREQDAGDARFSVTVGVTDSAGQKQARTVSRTVTNQALRVEVIPEAGPLVQGLSNTIYIFASYPDGRPVTNAQLTVSGVEKPVTTNKAGVAAFDLTPKSQKFSVLIKAADAQGSTGSRQVTLTCGQAPYDFIVRPDKAVYNGGDTMSIAALGSGSQPVFIDLIKDGQTMLTQTLGMANGSGACQIDLPPDVFGTLQLSAYRFMPGSAWAGCRTRVVYIKPPDQLTIKAVMDKKEYRPGTRGKMVLTLTDTKGSPTPGALSLAAVDEAVFQVLDQAPGMERSFYTVEQKLLQPVYAIYPWSPELSGSLGEEDRKLLEQAVFSVTANSEERPTGAGKEQLYSLADSSWPTRSQHVARQRQVALASVGTGWAIFWCFAGLIALFGLFILLRPVLVALGEVLVHVDKPFSDTGNSAGNALGCAVLFIFMSVVVGLAAIKLLGTNASATFSTVANSIGGAGAPAAADARAWKSAAKSEAADTVTATEVSRPESKPDPKPLNPNEPEKPSQVQTETTPVRVREWFPETLLWKPQLITDDEGRATLDLDLADSITTWRLTASAVTSDGRLGAMQEAVRVFQPFFVDLNLPVTLTRGDEVDVPVVVYNYLNKPQIVSLALKEESWFERLDDADRSIELAPQEVRATSYRLRVRKVGEFPLEVTARGSGVADAIRRQIEVVPDGRRIEKVVNGTLRNSTAVTLNVPENAIEGSPKLIIKVYPSTFSQLVEGLEGIFQMPYGCFEQTSSTTYPNILALDYLKRTGKSAPNTEKKARGFIHLGYQRLISFEVRGGGFDWFGRPPANRTLTAYGLMEFRDMARVYDVDRKLIDRTRAWLLKQRRPDGSWDPEGHGLHDDPTARGNLARLSTTAYIAWSVFGEGSDPIEAAATLRYLLSVEMGTINDPYVLALVCNALQALDVSGAAAQPYLDRLRSMEKLSADRKLVWWEQPAGGRTTFYGAGLSGQVETTSLAALAMIHSGKYGASTRSALNWIAQQKSANGTWYSTQATVLALKALLAGTDKTLGQDEPRRIEISLGKEVARRIAIPADQGDVMKQLDLSEFLVQGDNRLTITDATETASGFQVAFRYHEPAAKQPEKQEPLTINLDYDRTELTVNDTVKVSATVTNRMEQAAPMVMLDLPIPAGFAVDSDAFVKLVEAGTIAKFQLTPQKVIVYLRGLEPGKPLTLNYQLRATMPVKLTVPAALAYEYYDPSKQGRSAVTKMVVVARK